MLKTGLRSICLFSCSYHVAGICGENVFKSPAEIVIKQNDIIVMTPQTLLNALNNDTDLSLSIFTLMIFDECHNTTGNNPYNMLMSKYLALKLKQGAVLLPQVSSFLVLVKKTSQQVVYSLLIHEDNMGNVVPVKKIACTPVVQEPFNVTTL